MSAVLLLLLVALPLVGGLAAGRTGTADPARAA
jgi:hypothetical protein